MSGAMAKEGSVSLHYPQLTSSNYAVWSIKMRVIMEAQGMWDAVEADGVVEKRHDKMALAAIYQGIPDDTLFLLSEKDAAKEVWDALKTMRMGADSVGADSVKDAKVQTLKTELEGLRMKEAESVDDFAVRLTTIVNKIRVLGEKLEETNVVKKLLRAVSRKFLQIA